MALATAAGTLAIGSAIGGALGSSSARKKARKAARAQMAAIRREGEEDLRRFDIQTRDIEGTGRAAVGASGVHMSGSSKLYLDALSGELATQRKFMEESIEQNVQLARRGASTQTSASRWASTAQATGGILQGIGLLTS